MFIEHNYMVWGTTCDCGKDCSILQNKHHPWFDKEFSVKTECKKCGKGLSIGKEEASEFYNRKIFGYFEGISGTVIDLGCGDGFISEHLLNNETVQKIWAVDNEDENKESIDKLADKNPKIEFLNIDISELREHFTPGTVNCAVSRDVFMFLESPERFLEDLDVLKIEEFRQMGWYKTGEGRMKNTVPPDRIREILEENGWNVKIEYLDWYMCGYFISASRN